MQFLSCGCNGFIVSRRSGPDKERQAMPDRDRKYLKKKENNPHRSNQAIPTATRVPKKLTVSLFSSLRRSSNAPR